MQIPHRKTVVGTYLPDVVLAPCLVQRPFGVAALGDASAGLKARASFLLHGRARAAAVLMCNQQSTQRRPFQNRPGGQRPQRPLQATDWTNGVVAAAAARLAAPLVGAASAFHANAPTDRTAVAALNVRISLRLRSSLMIPPPRELRRVGLSKADVGRAGCNRLLQSCE